MIPPLARKELGQHYLSASVVAVPSRSETQSTVLMESMAAGIPVVASDTGGNSMMVIENTTGLLFPSGHAEALYLALKRLLTDESLLQAMGNAARRRHAELYSLEKTSASLRQVFRQIKESNHH